MIAVLNYRRTSEQVREFVKNLNVTFAMGPSEKLSIERNRKSNPYPAQFDGLEGIRLADRIHCGHNPFIVARLVKNVRLERVDGREEIRWDEPPTIPDWVERARQDRETRRRARDER